MSDKPPPLTGRIAIITGASAGIGLAVATDLAASGCRVVVNARRRDRLDAVVRGLNKGGGGGGGGGESESAVAVEGDASEPAVIEALFRAAIERFGGEADIVVVNAGRGLAGSVTNSDISQWEEMVRTNLIGASRLLRVATDRMLKMLPSNPEGETGMSGPWLGRPRDIIVLGSIAGRHISPFSSMYGATKFGVNSLAEALRREVGPRGIRVTLLAPAVVRSEFQQVAGYEPGAFGEFMNKIGPVLEPEDIARLVTFVVSQPAHVHINDIVIRPTRQDYP